LIGHELIERHADQLRALAPSTVIKERKTQRDRARWGDHNTGRGFRLSNEENRTTARLMRAQGVGLQAIADSLSVSIGSVHKWCKD